MNYFNKRIKGKKHEQEVANYLLKKNYEILEKNYYSGRYEIDLIALDQEVLVFIEVKYRTNNKSKLEFLNNYNPFASIPITKQRNIIKVAKIYLNKNSKFMKSFSRFDAIFVLDGLQSNRRKIIHLENAFNEVV